MSEPWNSLDPLVKHWNKIIVRAGPRETEGSQTAVSGEGTKKKNSSRNPSKPGVLFFLQPYLSLAVFFILFWGYFIKPMDPSGKYSAKGWNKRRKSTCYTRENKDTEDLFLGVSGNLISLYLCSLLNFLSSQKVKLWAVRRPRGSSEEGVALLGVLETPGLVGQEEGWRVSGL